MREERAGADDRDERRCDGVAVQVVVPDVVPELGRCEDLSERVLTATVLHARDTQATDDAADQYGDVPPEIVVPVLPSGQITGQHQQAGCAETEEQVTREERDEVVLLLEADAAALDDESDGPQRNRTDEPANCQRHDEAVAREPAKAREKADLVRNGHETTPHMGWR